MTGPSISERRRAERTPHSGPVEISFHNPAPMNFNAELIEMSSTGFRAAHHCKNLDPGTEIAYRREGAAGRARVIWTQVLQDHRVSGFLLL